MGAGLWSRAVSSVVKEFHPTLQRYRLVDHPRRAIGIVALSIQNPSQLADFGSLELVPARTDLVMRRRSVCNRLARRAPARGCLCQKK
jgi:hypothetical protein